MLSFWRSEEFKVLLHYQQSLHGIVANMLDYNIIVSKFELQSCYRIHFQTNALGKGIEPLYSSHLGIR